MTETATENTVMRNGWRGMAFLSENPEAAGQSCDAFPLSTGRVMIAAGGASASRTFSAPQVSDTETTSWLYGGILPVEEMSDVLATAFSGQEGHAEHTVARYSAVLAELIAWQVMSHPVSEGGYEETAIALSTALSRGLELLYARMSAHDDDVKADENACGVSVGVCRVTEDETAPHTYDVDIFATGGYRVYLLDRSGMSRLWHTRDSAFVAGKGEIIGGRRVRIVRDEPFAVVLLSESTCALSAVEHRATDDAPGMIWRYRMRLEDQILRQITGSVRERDVGENATRFFTGRANGRSCASGAILIAGGSFDNFRSICRERFHELENTVALLPDGYDPEGVRTQPSLEEMEHDFIRRAFRAYPRLLERTVEVLSTACLARLYGEEQPAEDTDGTNARRLTAAYVKEVFRSFDKDNDADREQIERNRRVIRSLLCDHWITLRPLLCDPTVDEDDESSRTRADETYETCLRLNRRMSSLLISRRAYLDEIEDRLADSLDVLRARRDDYMYGRAGDDAFDNWSAELVGNDGGRESVAEALTRHAETWRRESEEYRALMTAYTAEREVLFCKDACTEGGAWYDAYTAVTDGTLDDDTWETYITRAMQTDRTDPYRDLLETVRTVSDQIRALEERIASRGAEKKMVFTVTGDAEWQISCMRAALAEDAAWGEEVHRLVDDTLRAEYRTAVRHWHETEELLYRRRVAYETYRDMYVAMT